MYLAEGGGESQRNRREASAEKNERREKREGNREKAERERTLDDQPARWQTNCENFNAAFCDVRWINK